MAEANRKPQRIPEPYLVCEMYNAIEEKLGEPQRHFIPFPFKRGPQPCVAVHRAADGSNQIRVSLVIIPWDAPHSNSAVADPVCGRLLSLYRHLYKKRIRKVRLDEVISSLELTSHMEAPYRNVRLHRLLAETNGIVGQVAASKRSLVTDLKQAIAKFQSRAKQLEASWEPYVFFQPPHGDDVKYQTDQWLIEQWPAWEAAKTSPTRRLREHLHEAGQALPGNAWMLRQVMNTFRHRCAFLRLECSTASGAGRRKSLWSIWESEETK